MLMLCRGNISQLTTTTMYGPTKFKHLLWIKLPNSIYFPFGYKNPVLFVCRKGRKNSLSCVETTWKRVWDVFMSCLSLLKPRILYFYMISNVLFFNDWNIKILYLIIKSTLKIFFFKFLMPKKRFPNSNCFGKRTVQHFTPDMNILTGYETHCKFTDSLHVSGV